MSTRKDAYIDYLSTNDVGCNIAPSCLRCPLAQCKHDTPGLEFTWVGERDDHIFKLKKQGLSIELLARTFKISRRTVDRIIQRGGASNDERTPNVPNKGAKISLAQLQKTSYTLYDATSGPAFRTRPATQVWPGKCRRCKGAVKTNEWEKSAICMSCGRDPRKVAV